MLSQCLVFGGAAPMLGERSRLVRGVLAQLSQLFGATVLCHGVLQRESLSRDQLVSYRPLAGQPLTGLDRLHRDAGHCWPGHAEDVPLAMRRSGACCDGPTACAGRTSSPAAFAAATAIDVFYHYRYIGSRGRGGRSRGGVHEGAPLGRRPPKRLWPAPGGQPFGQARCRAMAFCTSTQPAGWPPGRHRTGRRPHGGT